MTTEIAKPQPTQPFESPQVKDAIHIVPVKRAKIRCEVWDMDANPPRLIGKTIAKYGDPRFRIKLGKFQRTYSIVYERDGLNLVKEYGKNYLYQTDFKNAVGVISFHPFKNQQVDSLVGDALLLEGFSEVFIRKGGMPFWYILIPLILALVLGGSLAIIAPQAIHDHDLAQQAVDLYNQEHAKLLALQSTVTNGGH